MDNTNDQSFLNTLSDLYDAGDSFVEYKRIFGKEPKIIEEPCIVLAVGAQPSYLGQALPEAAWGQGFMSRMIIVFSEERVPPKSSFLPSTIADKVLAHNLVHDMRSMLNLYGPMQWTPKAQALFDDLTVQEEHKIIPPVPTHPKLISYTGRREVHLTKLCTISACSRDNMMTIHEKDVIRARSWLLGAEKHMASGLMAVTAKSDSELIDELIDAIWQRYLKGGRVPVSRKYVIDFLIKRTPAMYINKVFSAALGTGKLKPLRDETGAIAAVIPDLSSV